MPRWTDILLLLLLLLLVAAAPAAVDAQGGGRRRYSHDGGLWGSAKDAVEPILRPACDSMRSRYDSLNDNGRFLAGACVGFGATKLAVGGESVRLLIALPSPYLLSPSIHFRRNPSPTFPTPRTATVKTLKTIGAAYIV